MFFMVLTYVLYISFCNVNEIGPHLQDLIVLFCVPCAVIYCSARVQNDEQEIF